ncbi:MAG TPA: hypothetical protein VM681_09375 [Candidatus Thermoplasmatota archaeon]|nr:hypothetical protein [Candidatus Thermoplasmatota archaeon]
MDAKVEALRRVKQAEEEARRIREEASRNAETIVREAQLSAARVLEEARTAADAEHRTGLARAKDELSREREAALQKGRREADAILARRNSKSFEKAAELLLSRFEQRVA